MSLYSAFEASLCLPLARDSRNGVTSEQIARPISRSSRGAVETCCQSSAKSFSAKITASAMIECSAVPTLVACAFECHCNYYDKCHHSYTRDDADLCAFG